MTDNNIELQKYKESLKSAWGYNDYNDWPIKFNSIMHLFLPAFTSEFFEDLDIIKNIGVDDEIICKSFGNPARIYRIINPLIYGMKRLNLGLEEQRERVLYLLKLVKAMKSGSVYNEDGKNIILSDSEVDNIMRRLQFMEADQEKARDLHRILGLLWAYTEAIFFRAHDVTKEIHGFYNLRGTKSKLLIREYMNLSPKTMWGNIPLLNADKITVYSVYGDNVDVSIDAYNHLFFKHGDYVEDLTGFAIVCDGKEIGLDALKLYVGKLINAIKYIHNWAIVSEKYEIVSKYADIYWYRKKALSDILGKDANVPKSVYENIRLGKPDERWEKRLSDKQIDILISLLI